MELKKLVVTMAAASSMAGLVACGSGSSPTASVSRVVTGPITAFGSVYVNGEKYETNGATVYVEDSEASESQLKVGMTVTVKTSSNGVADSIHFDDDVEGIVIGTTIAADNTGTLNVMGQTVTVDGNTIFESHVTAITTASQIVAGNIVEVSGSSSGTGSIVATRLEVKAESMADYIALGKTIEVKGIVASHNEVDQTFNIGSLVVDYSTAVKEMPAGSWNDLYVEVKSTQELVGGQMVASKVELEDGGSKGEHDEGDEVEVKGKVSEVVADTSVSVNGQTFLLDANTTYEHGVAADLIVDALVEVEGYTNTAGQLVAKKVEFEGHDDDSELEVKGDVISVSTTAVNEGTVEVGGLSIVVNNATMMQDKSMTADQHFNLSKLNAGDMVDIDYVDNGGIFTATKLEREVAGSATPQ